MASHYAISGREVRSIARELLRRRSPTLVEGGRKWRLAEVADEAGLHAWKPDHGTIGVLARGTESMGLCLRAPGIRRSRNGRARFSGRRRHHGRPDVRCSDIWIGGRTHTVVTGTLDWNTE